jgi:hypothetical protein
MDLRVIDSDSVEHSGVAQGKLCSALIPILILGLLCTVEGEITTPWFKESQC